MEKDNKFLQEVQFNVVNNTSSDIALNLFNLDSLSLIPTSGTNTPPTTQTSSIPSVLSRGITVNPINGDVFISQDAGSVDVYDSSNNLITTIPIGLQPYRSDYCPVNNSVYVTDFSTNQVYVIDCTSYSVTTTIVGFSNRLRGIEYCPTTNEMYTGTTGALSVQIIDCATNTIVSSPVTPFSQPQDLTYNSLQDQMYVSLTTTNQIGVYDCSTSLLISQIALTDQPYSIVFCPLNNYVYVTYSLNTIIDIIDCSTNTIFSSINYTGASTIYSSVFVSQLGLIYLLDETNNSIYQIDPNTNTITNTISQIFPTTIGDIVFSGVSNSLYVASGTTYIYLSPLIPIVINGSSNYNTFIQNLENEPISIKEIRISTPQTQLANNLDIIKTDASGNQSQYPNFPILGVSAWQDQGDISIVKFKDLVFDGRTYINQYLVNGNQTIQFVLQYEQINRMEITSVFDRFLPKKIPLKNMFEKFN